MNRDIISKKILVTEPIVKDGIEILEDAGFEIRVAPKADEETLVREAKGVAGILVRTAEITERIIKESEELEVIARHGVGVDNVPVKTATERGIIVVNAPKSNFKSVAEHTIGLMIACAKNLITTDKNLRNGNFQIRKKKIGISLQGRTLGIVGLGRIGSEVARKTKNAFNMKLIAYDPYVKEGNTQTRIKLLDDLDNLLEQSDFVSLHCPRTKETEGLIGIEELRKMKKTAYLINVARGGIVEEDMLTRALREGEIAGAAIDTFEREPPRKNHPLFESEKTIVTPHMGGLTTEAMTKMATHSAKGIVEVLSGEKPSYPVNPEIV